MTRWARANNSHKKSAEEATDWDEMWQGGSGNATDKSEEKEKNGEAGLSRNVGTEESGTNLRLENKDLKVKCCQCGSTEHEETRCKLRRSSESGDCPVICISNQYKETHCNLKRPLESENLIAICGKCGSNEHEVTRCKLRRPTDDQNDGSSSWNESRMANQKNLCYKCHDFHHYSNCPELSEEDKYKICYVCGSLEHTTKGCKKKNKETMPFARCFICKETGHISGKCPQNPNGIYINGGGCHICNANDHFSRNCPEKKKKKKEEEEIVLTKLDNNRSIEIDYVTFEDKKPAKQTTKIVNFK